MIKSKKKISLVGMFRQSHIYYVWYNTYVRSVYNIYYIAGSTAVQKFLKFLDITDKRVLCVLTHQQHELNR